MSKFNDYVIELELINRAMENLVSKDFDTLTMKEKLDLYVMSRELVARGEDLMLIIGKLENNE